jgi:hypothetical protein
MAGSVKHNAQFSRLGTDAEAETAWEEEHVITGVVLSVNGQSPDISGNVTVGGVGGGDVVGPASAAADDIALFDGTSGKLIKDSGVKITAFAPSYHNHQAGIEGSPTITEGTGTFTVASGEAWFFTDSTRETLALHTITASGTMTPTDDQTGYVCADRDTDTWVILSTIADIDYLRYVPYFIVFKRAGSNNLHTEVISLKAHGEVESNYHRTLHTNKYGRESGLDAIAVDGTLNLTCNAGIVWAVTTPYDILAVTTATRQFECERDGTVTSHTSPIIRNDVYDDGTGFQALTTGEFVINWIWRGIESQDHVYTMLSNKFTSAEAARSTNNIGAIPDLISSHALLIGRVIVEYNGVVDAGNIESAFSETFSAASGITQHNDLSGIQGGSSAASEYYHVPAQIFSNLTSGVYQATSATSNITSNAFPSANTTQFAGTNFAGTNISGTMGTNGLSLSVAAGGGGADGYNIIAAGGSTAASTGTINFSNSNGVSFGLNGSVVTASHNGLTTAALSNHTHSDLYIAKGDSTAYQTGTLANTFFQTANSSNLVAVTRSTEWATSVLSGTSNNLAAATHTHSQYQSTGAYLTTAKQSNAPMVTQWVAGSVTQNGSNNQVVFTGSNGISVHGNGSTISISLIDNHHVEGLMLAGNNFGTAYSIMSSGSQTINFAGAISGSQNGNAFTISAPTQSVQTQNSVLVNGQSGAITVAGTNAGATGVGVTVNSSGVSVSAVTNYSTGYSAKAESTHVHTIQTTTIAGSTVAITNASNGATIAMPPFITTYAAQTADTNKVGIGNVSTVSTAGVNMTGSADTNGVTLAVPAWLTNAGGGGNTVTISGSNGSIQSNGLSFLGSGVAQVYTTTGNQFVVSVPSGGGAGDGWNPIAAGGSTANSTQSIVFGNANSMSFSLNGSTITGSFDGHTVLSNASILVTNGNSASFLGQDGAYHSVAGGGGAGVTASRIYPFPTTPVTTVAQSQNTIFLNHFIAPHNASFSKGESYISIGVGSTTSGTRRCDMTVRLGIYTYNNSTLSLYASGSQTYQVSCTSNATASHAGIRVLSVPISGMFSQGVPYVIAHCISTNALTSVTLGPIYATGLTVAGANDFGVSTNNSNRQWYPGEGCFATSSGAMPQSIRIGTDVLGSVPFRRPWIEFMNESLG